MMACVVFFPWCFGLLFLANFGGWFAVDSLLDRLAAPDGSRWMLGGFIVLQLTGMAAIFRRAWARVSAGHGHGASAALAGPDLESAPGFTDGSG